MMNTPRAIVKLVDVLNDRPDLFPLSVLDLEILAVICEQKRCTTAEIAASVDRKHTDILNRLWPLEKRGIIVRHRVSTPGKRGSHYLISLG